MWRIAIAIAIVALCVVLSGCAAMSDRYATSQQRHSCGNVWDICPGDNAAVDKIRSVLEGRN